MSNEFDAIMARMETASKELDKEIRKLKVNLGLVKEKADD